MLLERLRQAYLDHPSAFNGLGAAVGAVLALLLPADLAAAVTVLLISVSTVLTYASVTPTIGADVETFSDGSKAVSPRLPAGPSGPSVGPIDPSAGSSWYDEPIPGIRKVRKGRAKGQSGQVGLALLIIVLFLLFGYGAIAFEALRWLFIILLVVILLSAVGGMDRWRRW